MPANLLEGQDASDVSVYIAKCAGNTNCGVTASNQNAPTTTAPGGGTSTGTKPNGKQVFVDAGCGSCHTLKDAGAKGNVGPNLDQLKPSKQTVAHQVEVGGGAMPAFKGQLTDAQIQAVADYVARVAGK